MADCFEPKNESAIVETQEPKVETQSTDQEHVNGNSDHQDQETPSSRNVPDAIALTYKLNPMAKEFVPSSYSCKNNQVNQRIKNTTRINIARRKETIRRTIYVSEIDHQVTEAQLAGLFLQVGSIVDCRISSNPNNNSGLHFAFIEFSDKESADSALNLSGTKVGSYPVRVVPSRTGIVPVNPTFLPRSKDEYDVCMRTVYCTNIDKNVDQGNVRFFFESFCGEVRRLRLLRDCNSSTSVAFVEFKQDESAIAALKLSGAVLGSLPIRVNPSKTPLRPLLP